MTEFEYEYPDLPADAYGGDTGNLAAFYDESAGSYDLEAEYASSPLAVGAGLIQQALVDGRAQALNEIAEATQVQQGQIESELLAAEVDRRLGERFSVANVTPRPGQQQEVLHWHPENRAEFADWIQEDPTRVPVEWLSGDVGLAERRMADAWETFSREKLAEARVSNWEKIRSAGLGDGGVARSYSELTRMANGG